MIIAANLFANLESNYIYPINKINDKKISNLFAQLTSNSKVSQHEFTHMGRNIIVNQAASSTAIIDFKEFCIQAYSVNDYQIITKNFSTIFLVNIPKLSIEELDQFKRFSNFIDICYEYKINMIYADCKIEDIYTEKKGGFEFNRIISRIKELQAKKLINV